MRAKEAAKHTKAKDKFQDTVVKPGAGAGAVGAQVGSADIERPAVPVAKGTESESEGMEEIPIAGRTKMTVPKAKSVQDSSSNTEVSEEKKKEKAKAADEESTEPLDAKSELNLILKRAPGMICAIVPRLRLVRYETREETRTNNPWCSSSHHLLQILLPVQQESQVHSAGPLRHHTAAIRRRARPASDRTGSPTTSEGEYRTGYCSQYSGEWQEYRGWR